MVSCLVLNDAGARGGPGSPNSDQDKGKLTMTAVVWTAPRPMVVRVAGGIWMAGEYQEFTERRTRAMLSINRPATAANRILFQDVVVPLWTEGYDSKNPQTFAAILGNEAAQLESIAVEKGDRIAVGFYWDDKALKPGLEIWNRYSNHRRVRSLVLPGDGQSTATEDGEPPARADGGY